MAAWGLREFLRLADVFGFCCASAAAQTVVACWLDQLDIGFRVFDLKLIFNMSAKGFVVVITHETPPLLVNE